jgi:hypothetical protein
VVGKDICVFVKVMANANTLEEAYFWKSLHEQYRGDLFDRSGGVPQ